MQLVHNLLEQERVEHMLIGGLGLSCYGSTRATSDVDILIYEGILSEPKVVEEGTAMERRKMYVKCPTGYIFEIKGYQ